MPADALVGSADNYWPQTYYPRTPDPFAAAPVSVRIGSAAIADIRIARMNTVRVSGKILVPPLDQPARRPVNIRPLRVDPRFADEAIVRQFPRLEEVWRSSSMTRAPVFRSICGSILWRGIGKPRPMAARNRLPRERPNCSNVPNRPLPHPEAQHCGTHSRSLAASSIGTVCGVGITPPSIPARFGIYATCRSFSVSATFSCLFRCAGRLFLLEQRTIKPDKTIT